MRQLRLELLQPFARDVEHLDLFLASLPGACLAADAQTGAEIRLGQLLGLQIGQEGFQLFDAI
jgi:hypothetical protein